MLRIYPVALDVLASLPPLLAQIARADSDLARQMRRASSPIILNLAEGSYSRGKLRQARYHHALGSARETLACIEVAVALRYVRELPPPVAAGLHRIIGTLVKTLAVA